MKSLQGIDSAHEQENETVLWLAPTGFGLVVWTQGKGQSLHEGEQVWQISPKEPVRVVHPNEE